MSKKFLPKVVLIAVMICAIFATSAVVMAEPNVATQPTPVSEVKIMHISDTHYIPTYYCYTGELKENDFATKIKGDPKLMLESYAVLERTVELIKENCPDYLFVTGDITSNGEMQALIDVANALRKVQNEVRETNPRFQILVVPGNHDVFNNRHASNYNYEDGKKKDARSASREEFVKIFAGLGFPDITDAEAEAFYNGDQRDAWLVNGHHLPYTPNGDVAFVNSTNYENLRFEYYVPTLSTPKIDELGGLTYIVFDDEKKVSIVGFDTTLSVKGDQRTEGEYQKSNLDWYTAKDLSGYTEISLGHHNIINHYTKQEQYTQAFVTYGWEEVAERLASHGVKYSFTGHFHASDVASYVSFNGNTMYDVETAATISKGAGVRNVTIKDYGNGKQDFVTKMLEMDKADFSYLINHNIMPAGYDDCFIDKAKGIVSIPKYIDAKLFTPYLENMIDSFISTTKIYGMLDGLKPMSVAGIKIDLKEVVYELINQINTEVLKGYTYKGDIESLRLPENKLIGYAHELLSGAIKKDVTTKKALDELVLYCYGAHLTGGEPASETELPQWVQDAFAEFRNGNNLGMIIDEVIFSENGIYNLVDKLAKTPLDLTKCKNSIKSIDKLVALLGIEVDTRAVVLDTLAPKLLENDLVKQLLDSKGIALHLKADTLMLSLDAIFDSYLTDSLKRGVGSILVDIASSFATDESYDGTYNEEVTHKVNKTDAYSEMGTGKAIIEPTYANGRMPSQLTLTFGADPKTEENFVWFTSQYAPHGDIQYKVKGSSDWTTESASSRLMPYSFPLFDLGLFSTKTDKNIMRHNARLHGLKAGTAYEYRVGDSTRNVWTEVGTFTTAPDSNTAFEVSVIADIQGMENGSYKTTFDNLNKTNKLFRNNTPDFLINLGDFVDDGNNFNYWGYALNTPSEYWRNLTQIPVAGNHEGKNYVSGKVKDRKKPTNVVIEKMEYTPLNFHFDLGGDMLTAKQYYSFDYSGVHFVVLDTNDFDRNTGKLSDNQTAWLNNDLKNTTAKAKVVLTHKGMYSSGAHSLDNEVIAMREQLSPIFYENKVDIVLQGHDHTYSETPRLDGKGQPAEDGVLYVTMGTMGDKCYKYVANDNVPIEEGTELHNPSLVSQTMGKLSFDGEKLSYQGYILKNGEFVKVEEYRGTTAGAGNLTWLWITLGVVGAAAVVGVVSLVIKRSKGKKVDSAQ